MRRWTYLAAVVALAACSSPAPTPSATASPSIAPSAVSGAWKVLATADTAGAGWSPDGRWLLAWAAATNGSPAQSQITLDDANGAVVRTYQAELPVQLVTVWVDDHSFVIAKNGANFLGTVESAGLSPNLPTFPGGVVSSGHGALAYETSEKLDASAKFVVWTPNDSPGSPRPGVPVAWSNDGTKLAVWHWSSGASGPDALGWIEVLGWPGLRPLGAIHQPLGWTEGSFDASGRYVLFNGEVLDLNTHATSALPLPGPSVSPAADPANASRFPAAAAPLGGDQSAAVSADGSTVVIWNYAEAGPVTVIRGQASHSFAVPGLVEPPSPALSPDGSSIVLTCLAPDGSSESLLLAP